MIHASTHKDQMVWGQETTLQLKVTLFSLFLLLNLQNVNGGGGREGGKRKIAFLILSCHALSWE